MDYNAMSLAKLQAEMRKNIEARMKLKDTARTIADAMQKKIAAEEAKRKVEAMDDEERANVALVLKATAIKSAEKVPSPGTG